jgi:hypothetical protein
MRHLVLGLLALAACKRPPATPHDSGHAAPVDAAMPIPAHVDAALGSPEHPQPTPAQAPGKTRALRVYIAGESIERWNRFTSAPFSKGGEVASPGTNSDDEYGWMVPFADKLHRRAPDLAVEWVGEETWRDYDDQPYDGSYPTKAAPKTSSIAGSSIDSWLEARHAELDKPRHCYDVAIAARGGNDFELDNDADVEASLTQLIELLARGSSCQKRPLVIVTGHLPDDQRSEGAGPDGATYTKKERHRYVERIRAAADAAAKRGLPVRFIDMFTPFVENRATDGFPKPTWSKGGIPDFTKIGRTNDRMHPRRLASIYAGELVADGLDLAELRALP